MIHFSQELPDLQLVLYLNEPDEDLVNETSDEGDSD